MNTLELSQILIGFLIGLSTTSLIWIRMLRRHYQNLTTLKQAEQQIKRAEKDLESLISQIYHKDIYPELCRAEGLFRLSSMQIDQALEDCELASRPDHYRYMSLVQKALIDLKKNIIGPGIIEMVTLKERFAIIIKKYNHHV